MAPPSALVFALLLIVAGLAGCAGDEETGPRVRGSEPKPSQLPARVEHVVGNEGYRVTGGPKGTMIALDSRSAVEALAVDLVASDGEGAKDKAQLSLEVREEGLRAQATLRQMTTGATSGDPGAKDYLGGVAHNVEVFGDTGRGPAVLPKVNAYLWIAGKVRLHVDGQAQSGTYLAWIALTQGLRAPSGGAALATVDPENLQLHVILPGKLLAGEAIPKTADGFLYYMFERVDVRPLEAAAREDVGRELQAPDVANRPPVPSFQTFVGSTATDRGARGAGALAVRLDASASGDPDPGDAIRTYGWRVWSVAANRSLVWPPTTASGANYTHNFTSDGVKQIELVVRDARAAVASLNRTFYVNRDVTFESEPNLHARTASGGTACKPDVNCFRHQITVEPLATGAVFTLADNGSSALERVHLMLYGPGGGPGDPPLTAGSEPLAQASGTTLSVPADKLTAPSAGYNVWVWWEQGAQVKYTLNARVNFAPTAS